MANNPSYANLGGTGDRTAIITVTSNLTKGWGQWYDLVDGSQADEMYWEDAYSPIGKYIQFDFGAGVSKTITEAKFYQSNTTLHATVQWNGSVSDGTTWVAIGSTFRLGGATTQTQTSLGANAAGYRYYRLICPSGFYSWSSSSWIREFEFKIDDYSVGGKGGKFVSVGGNIYSSAMGPVGGNVYHMGTE